MRRKFTKKYLKELYKSYFFISCASIGEKYPEYKKHYSKMIRSQFKINPKKSILEDSKKCKSLLTKDVNFLRVLLLMSFEDAILNGEIK